ncbi:MULTISPECIES: LysR family transcriptional regulator [Alteromonas]|uniref:LysR substrate binding domain protein n=1 Tax=Alteromonas macleodii TaxID=28108 RepID=A0A1E7DCS1_ALTMA|nr:MULTISPECIES: LysR family transcriptional regulator [Alteromonas]AMN12273.1 transcriptional regulator [Alteromonas macleodii]OES31089.1 lysR substrate binding domain protein [Alteromonas macleodii]OES31192.1 lysR substrate binding domain protein [Alteromonas macleodii]OES31633.1 lysR substrate binding domain protein [Alteromonas macleodii]OES40818.1 lysR substrate binding domain protein [Alteromonas macleodii]|tara:strand:- start:9 stop:914 length:906 start_codon:yes stop_codon:yes gene_type:complete
MDRFDMLTRFVETARLGSFSAAAALLGLPKSSISQAVTNLEKQLGTRLFNRSTRSVSLTSDGETFLPQSIALLSEWDALQSQFLTSADSVSGELRIDMPSRFATNILLPILGEFISTYPKITLRVSSVDRKVDLIKEGFDCVIRVGALADSSLVARRLLTYPIYNCVSPDYATKWGIPQSLEDLANHKLIDYSHTLSHKTPEFEFMKGGELHGVEMQSLLSVNSTQAYFAACASGLGIAQIPSVGVESELKEGKLIRVLPEFEAQAMPVNLLYPSRRQMPLRLKVFSEWLVDKLSENKKPC